MSEPSTVEAPQSVEDILYGNNVVNRRELDQQLQERAPALVASERDAIVEDINTALRNTGLTNNVNHVITQLALSETTEEQRKEWQQETLHELRQKFGDSMHHELQRAERYAAQRPKLRELLTESGAADHPKVILGLIDAARRAGQ